MTGYDETKAALFGEIKRQLEDGGIEKHQTHMQPKIVKDLALAFRYVAGGPQPGSHVEG